MKINNARTNALNGLRKLVVQWHATKRGKVKVALRARMASANDRFHARWKHDGVVALFKAAK